MYNPQDGLPPFQMWVPLRIGHSCAAGSTEKSTRKNPQSMAWLPQNRSVTVL